MSSRLKTFSTRLCYLGSLSVESTSAGPVQLYRLLQGWPSDMVCVVEADCQVSEPHRRLSGVRYLTLDPVFRRGWFFARNRTPSLFWIALRIHSLWQAWSAAKLIAPFQPDAILTIHERFGWLTAAELARLLGVPLHLILHDDWFRNLPMAASLKPRFEKAIAGVYRAAVSRLCISPYMEEDYAVRFGVEGTVLYPTRDADSPSHELRNGVLAQDRPLTVAYAGNIFHSGYWEALRDLATALQAVGGTLLVFGPTTAGQAQANGLTARNVVLRGFVPDLIGSLRAEAHAAFLPMTFDEKVKRNMQLSFPSKLAEYTAAAVPLLIYGPDYCSAVRWARDNPDSAEVVTQPGCLALSRALSRLQDGRRRELLARRSFCLGGRDFSYQAVSAVFEAALCPDRPSPTGEEMSYQSACSVR